MACRVWHEWNSVSIVRVRFPGSQSNLLTDSLPTSAALDMSNVGAILMVGADLFHLVKL
jgi:hypothetical protein